MMHNRIVSTMESSTTVTPTEDGVTIRQFYHLRLKSSSSRESRKRDSGTSSPLPLDIRDSHQFDSVPLPSSSTSASNCARMNPGASNVPRPLSHSNRRSATRIHKTSQPLNEEEGNVDDADYDSSDSMFSEDESSNASDSSPEIRDIYLGGSCMRRTRWRQDYVIPLLKSKGISYHNPDEFDTSLSMGDIQYMAEMTFKSASEVEVVDDEAQQLQRMLEEPVFKPNLLDESRVLLFVITNETRSLAPMTLAAHYIGLGYDVVLCVQMLTDSIIYGNEVVSCNWCSWFLDMSGIQVNGFKCFS